MFGSVALTEVTLARPATRFPAGPSPYFRIVLNVNATSSAVRGSPSDHVASGVVWKVHVSPSED